MGRRLRIPRNGHVAFKIPDDLTLCRFGFLTNIVVFHVADLDVGGLIVIVVVVAFKIPDVLT